MKRILRLSTLTVAMVAVVSLVNIAPGFQRAAQAQPVLGAFRQTYYYGPGYGGYPVYGQGPYAYGTYGGNGYQNYGAGPYGYGSSVNYGIQSYGPYRRTYYTPIGNMTTYGPYGFRGFDNYSYGF